MALYLGNSGKLKLYLNNVAYCIHLGVVQQPTTGVSLTLSDNCVLKDLSGLIITVKEDE